MNNQKEYIVYKHTSPSGKVYIGITCQKPKSRWRNGEGYRPRQGELTPFWRAIEKYGWGNIKHEIVATHLSRKEACLMEKELIRKFKSDDSQYGYNVLKGGEIPLLDCPKVVREYMKQSAYKKWEKTDYIDSHTGENHWTHKKGFSRKSIEAMKKANIGKKRTLEQIEFLREKGKHQKRFYGADNKTSKPVICFSLDGIEIKRYGGMSEASRETGATFQGISKVCLGKQKTAGGYIWKYA